MEFGKFFEQIQKRCLPGIWSKGIGLSRENQVILDQAEEDEYVFRVLASDHPVSRKVCIWPELDWEEVDWHCDCGSRAEICSHFVAALIFLKSKKSTRAGAQIQSEGLTSSPVASRVQYRLIRKGEMLGFERWIVQPGGLPPIQLLDSLVSFVGGVSSGRISCVPVVATQEDFAVDSALGDQKRGELARSVWLRLFKILAQVSGAQILLDGKPIRVSASSLRISAKLSEEKGGFRLHQLQEPTLSEAFRNGAVLCNEVGNEVGSEVGSEVSGGVLRAFEIPFLTPQEREWLSGTGRFFPKSELIQLMTEVVPALESKMNVVKPLTGLPEVRKVAPKVVIELDAEAQETSAGSILSVLPRIVYSEESGSSEFGENSKAHSVIYLPDPSAEKILIRKLQNELQLAPGQRLRLTGDAAVDFRLRLKNWETSGKGKEAFALNPELVPQLKITESEFQVSFGLTDFKTNSAGFAQQADPKRVFQAWAQNSNYVPLLSGGWAVLPKDWLNRYGERVAALLNAVADAKVASSGAPIPVYLVPQLQELHSELQGEFKGDPGDKSKTLGRISPLPDSFQRLMKLLDHVHEIESVPLPPALTAILRPYQQIGVNWLTFLRKAGVGGLLADDMGLGKTLQALCVVQGRTLVVTPTSVLHSWADQIRQFRPDLSIKIFHGNQRDLDPQVDITVTTYGVLRKDRALLANIHWDTLILDEAQTIKNPESQITQACHALRSEFKIALTGTPVENRLEDLWSQFQFLIPGLLGDLATFKETYSGWISRAAGSTQGESLRRLRERVKPFILRRLKKEVAPELPPKIEKILYCQFTPQEKEIYQSILASSRNEVLKELETGGNLMAALELLLRLRQACCHSALIPGQSEYLGPQYQSSKVELLLETLENSIELGHKSLVFSQWTSLLDWVEPGLQAKQIPFLRLDGSTIDRADVVRKFQDENSEIPVFLISLKAGGVGLTLTAADHVYFLDPWWNPAVEEQAIDRAHRIGQSNTVVVHRLVAENSVEERILELQKAKTILAQAVLAREETSGNLPLTREDLLALLRD